MQAADENKGGFLGNLRQFFIGLTTKLAPYSQPNDETKASHRRQKMIMAGYDKPRASVIFYGLKIILAVVFPVLVYLGVIFSQSGDRVFAAGDFAGGRGAAGILCAGIVG